MGIKKEARIKVGITAFFVLVAIGFTLEPLISLILKTKTLPTGTISLLVAAPAINKQPDFFDAITRQIPPTHGWAANTDLINKAKDLISSLKTSAVTIQGQSIVIAAGNDPEKTMAEIRRFLSKLTPFEIKTILPDQTSMIETVIDPSLILVKTDNDLKPSSWTFAQSNPQLSVTKSGYTTLISINYPQNVESQNYKTLTKCSVITNGIKEVEFETGEQTAMPAMFSSFLAYFRYFSCFQSFSTFVH